MRELEHELEACKIEVSRERTRVMERESVIVQQREDVQRMAQKGKGKNARFETDTELEERYREAVEEKKGSFFVGTHSKMGLMFYVLSALEALIATLRTHLTRLTSELSSHQQLLSELRSLRESDARTLREKSAEVEQLREEVERLAGEVEVLKGVVEEGLNERRAVREASTQVEEKEDDNDEPEGTEDLRENIDDEEQEQDKTSLVPPRANVDRTMRTDHATIGSSNPAATPSRPFIDDEELNRISFELEERRSDRSGSSLSRSQKDISGSSEHLRRGQRVPSPSPDARLPPVPIDIPRVQSPQSMSRSAAPAPGPAHTSRRFSHGRSQAPAQYNLSTPFPQIRGSHLEKLFFSAPEHNAKTCTVCHRRTRRPESPSWIPRRDRDMRARVEDDADDDEGFVEGPDTRNVKGKQRERPAFSQHRRDGNSNKLPPQTVLARVLRELEDDFTHYKRSAAPVLANLPC